MTRPGRSKPRTYKKNKEFGTKAKAKNLKAKTKNIQKPFAQRNITMKKYSMFDECFKYVQMISHNQHANHL